MRFSAWAVLALLSLFAVKVRCEDGFDLADAIGDDDEEATVPSTTKPVSAPAGGAGGDPGLDLSDAFDSEDPTVKPPPPPAPTKAPIKPNPKPGAGAGDLDLSDALDPNNDIGGKGKGGAGKGDKGYDGEGRGDGQPNNRGGTGGAFTDDDLKDIGDYKPDKGKGGSGSRGDGESDHTDNSDYDGTMAETGTIAGIVSAVGVALVGAITSYISYQKKKFCFAVQQSLNTGDMVKAENPDAVVATEPQVQQTLLQPPNAEPPTEENAV
ncbi:CD99 antigen-like protein 2 isoform X1 [Engraulis encrasicolus]|uniref:CD99 antigen-like protein 2 isoform X1 n=1 Tax=Engraulis encrasicolus TaxID=184585 RepID=UPI002FD36A9B